MSTPGSAVMSWWQSLQDKDMPALARMTIDDYLGSNADGLRSRFRNAATVPRRPSAAPQLRAMSEFPHPTAEGGQPRQGGRKLGHDRAA